MKEKIIEYLEKYFITEDQLLLESQINKELITTLQRLEALPKASYEMNFGVSIHNYIWGTLTLGPESYTKKFYPRCFSKVVNTCIDLHKKCAENQFGSEAKNFFEAQLREALQTREFKEYQDKPIIAENDSINEPLFRHYFEHTWLHWLSGTHGICVKNPETAHDVVRKDISVWKLKKLTHNATKKTYNDQEIEDLKKALDTFDQNTMPFSPHEFHLSSRCRYYAFAKIFVRAESR